jgi:pimeloyl-ACP methyl ester carboxylesterase
MFDQRLWQRLAGIALMAEIATGIANAQPADSYTTVNGLRLHTLEWGTAGKRPLILLHGIARVAHNFDHVAPHFAADYHVVAIDMRGHGDSDWHAGGAYMVEDYVADIEALIVQRDWRDIVLWGNSTGGRVAQMIGGRRPDLVTAIISEDVGPERPAAVSNRRAGRMAREAEGWTTREELLAQLKLDYPRTAEPLLKAFAQHGSKSNTNGRVIWKRDPKILDGFVPTELWATISRISAPILYLLGGASDIVPPETQTRLLQTLPQVQIVTMPGLGHYPSDEKPDEAVAIVRRFLVEARGASGAR